MNLFINTKNLTIFVISIILISFLLIFLYLYPLFYKKRERKKLTHLVYKKIYKYAVIKDFYLINKLPLIKNEEYLGDIDHLLFSNKYMYVIKTRYFDGIISAHKDDNVWIKYNSKGYKEELNNPLQLNSKRCDIFSEIKHIDRSFLVSIVVVNNSINIKNAAELNSFNSYFVKKKDLIKLIKKIEKRNISDFNSDVLDYEVKEIANELGRKY